MNNLEENLRKIKIRDIGEEERESLWHRIMVGRVEEESRRGLLSISVFNFSMNKLMIGALALVLILGGGGVVAASSNGSGPGDFLFPIDLAIEKFQIKFASEDQKTELRFKFAEERVEEIKHVSEEKSSPAVLVTDLSASNVTEIEADVFTNETIVKIEAGDKKYGYLSAIKTKAELATEISTKYSIEKSKVEILLDFEVENRASQADDKGFLNKTHSINFSAEESSDISLALTELEKLLRDNEDNDQAEEIRKALNEIFVLLGDDADLEVKRKDGEIKIESGNIKIEIKLDKDNSGKSGDSNDSLDDDSDDDSSKDNDVDDDSDDSVLNGDTKEDDSEVFCRGEWRDPEDCNDGISVNAGGSLNVNLGSNDDEEDDIENDSGGGSDDDEDLDEDSGNGNSGSGGGDDDVEDDD